MFRSGPGSSQMPFVPRVYVRHEIRWEYHVLPIQADHLPDAKALNDLGDEGWELIAALPQALYFKRQVD